MKRVSVVLAAALAVLLACLVSGCGGSSSSLDSLTTKQLLDKARAQISAQKYVTISGKLVKSGSPASLDLEYVGNDSTGTITLGGAQIDIKAIGGTTYFKPSPAFWAQQLGSNASTVTKAIGSRWIVADPSNTGFAELIELSKKRFLTKDVLSPAAKVTKGKTTTVDGVEVIPLTSKNSTLYLDASTGRPVKVSGKPGSAGGSGSATFSYNSVPAPTAPAKSDQIDLSALLKK